MGKGNGRMVGGRYHFIMVRSFDFILGATAALTPLQLETRFWGQSYLDLEWGGVRGP